MIGDDIVSDVGGAQACGIRGVQVRTGKFRYHKTFFYFVILDRKIAQYYPPSDSCNVLCVLSDFWLSL